MQSHRFRADIERTGGGRIVILSTSWQTVALMAPQDHLYRDFIVELHRRMKAAGSKATLTGGFGTKTYAAAIVVLALVGLAIAGLLVRALRPANSPARCFWSASPRCSPGRSAALLVATGRSATALMIFRSDCCRDRPRSQPA